MFGDKEDAKEPEPEFAPFIDDSEFAFLEDDPSHSAHLRALQDDRTQPARPKSVCVRSLHSDCARARRPRQARSSRERDVRLWFF